MDYAHSDERTKRHETDKKLEPIGEPFRSEYDGIVNLASI
jgi:hypothetical protein